MRHMDQVLVFDADDTLWHNSILFERVIDDFTGWLAHPTLDRAEIRGILNEIEAANTVAHGFGTEVFLRSLGDCFERLSQRPRTEGDLRAIRELATALVEHRIDLLPGVTETLVELGSRHRLLMLTKGEAGEQRRKIDASGVAGLFESVHIVPDKTPQTYRTLAAERDLDPAVTWMIGNSPKSDILPARAVGMRAVFIPNPDTWLLELAELDVADTGVLTLQAFPQLAEHF